MFASNRVVDNDDILRASADLTVVHVALFRFGLAGARVDRPGCSRFRWVPQNHSFRGNVTSGSASVRHPQLNWVI